MVARHILVRQVHGVRDRLLAVDALLSAHPRDQRVDLACEGFPPIEEYGA
jgi:hypothetical protein